MIKKVFALISVLIATATVAAQTPETPTQTVESGKITWSVKLKNPDTRVGESTQLLVTGKLPENWHTYAPQLPHKDGGFFVVEPKLDLEGNLALPAGDPIYPPAKIVLDTGFQVPVAWYSGEFTFALPITIADNKAKQLMLSVKAQACDDKGCDRPRTAILGLDFTPAAGAPRPERTQPDSTEPTQTEGFHAPDEAISTANPEVFAAAQQGIVPGAKAPTTQNQTGSSDDGSTTKAIEAAKSQGPLAFFLLSFAAGLLALLTPCVWPMIPITVSYFTKKSEEGKSAVLGSAAAYCFGIISTFVGLGLVVTAAFGATGVQKLAASPIANALLGILFIVLALNLFGLFEIAVPAKFVNNIQGKSKSAGLFAPVLLGFVFSLTTFTCTVPFVGTILVSATTGDYFYPILGMLGFSLAFAIPFFALALLPNTLKKLPKSGSWLNSVKAYMGFLELAAALKFISNIDVVLNDPLWLPFAAFGAVWFAIMISAALYLFGIIKMPHDDGTKIGLGRKLFGLANVGVAIWLLAGITNPANLGQLVGFYPPKQQGESAGALTWNENFEEIKATAQAEGKPIFINFTGKTCTNCRVMEYQKFPLPGYRKELEKFARVELYTDRETPEDEKNAKFREELTKSATNPVYVIMKPDGTLVSQYPGLAQSDEEFIKWMQENYTKASQ
jgi:thiol:disulfide interchange protein DsbD